MNCTKCGAVTVPGSRFCGECGTPTTAAAKTAPVPAAGVRQDTRPRAHDAFAQTMAAPPPGVPRPAPVLSTIPQQHQVPPTAPATTPAPVRNPTPVVTRAAPLAAGGAHTTHPTAPMPNPNRELVGSTLNGRYLVKDRIGEGGFGAVYRGEQIAMGRECAIKVLHGKMARDPQVVGRFRREAQAASVLRAAHTVAIYDFDQTPEGVLYLAMELLHGTSLHEAMQEGLMSAARVAHILDGIADSLGEAHSHGIVHRDIKPENVFLEERNGDADFVKVLDFGIAKIISGEEKGGPQLTAAGQTLGTVEYMSPEQLMGLALDGRSDLYALGNLAYELLCGHLPFGNLRTPGEQITAHLKTVPPAPSKAHPELSIPPLLDEIILKLLQKQRDNRYKDAAELQVALRQVPAAVLAMGATAARPARVAETGPRAQGLGPRSEVVDDHGPTRHDIPIFTEQHRSIVAKNRGNLGYVVAGVVFLVVALAAAVMLMGHKANASELPSPARMVPASCEGLVAADVQRLRNGTPAAALDPIFALLRTQLERVGSDPEKLAHLALGIESSGEAKDNAPSTKAARKSKRRLGSGIEGSVLIVDVPVDKAKTDAVLAERLSPGERYRGGSYKGQKIRKGPAGEYAYLPNDRVLIAAGSSVSGSIDLYQGTGRALVDGAPSALLDRVGVTSGAGPAAFGWAALDARQRRQLDHYVPGSSSVEEVAGAFDLGPAGADLKAVGRCGSPEGAERTVTATRTALAGLKRNTLVMLTGLGVVSDAVQVHSDGALVSWSLHLSPAQYGTVATRVSLVVAAAVRSAMAAPSVSTASGSAAATVPGDAGAHHLAAAAR